LCMLGLFLFSACSSDNQFPEEEIKEHKPAYTFDPNVEIDEEFTADENLTIKRNVNSYGYYDGVSSFGRLVVTDEDLLVLRNSHLTQTEISELQKKGKTLFYVVNLGEADKTADYWEEGWKVNDPEFIFEKIEAEGTEYVTVFWNPFWQAIVYEQVVDLALLGYDGVVLEGLDYYEYFRKKGWQRTDKEMVEYVSRIRNISLDQKEDFKIFMGDGLTIYNFNNLSSFVDGVLVKDIWYTDGKRNSLKNSVVKLEKLIDVKEDEKSILSLDIVSDEKEACLYYSLCGAKNISCFAIFDDGEGVSKAVCEE
ncbi:MAG: endo alpha-1,4 polygalactosaminidase, partial [Nanoarchaeota archaeon]